MAPLPVIGNCVRVALNWNSVGGVKPVNVLHLITSLSNEADIADSLTSALHDAATSPFGFMHEAFALQSTTVTLLSGSTAGQVIPVAHSVLGASTGGMVPQVAAVLSLHTLTRGPRGRGRLYIGPVGEANIDAGLLTPSPAGIANILAAWDDVETSLAGDAISLGVASYTHSEVNGVSSISMRPQAGTQRRRQDQLV